MTKVNLIKVFINEEGKFGNPLGIILDEEQIIDKKERLSLIAKLKFSEVVFINDLKTGSISIFNPQQEITFAGHALIGSSFFIRNITHKPIQYLKSHNSKTFTWQENDITWIKSEINIIPPWKYLALDSAKKVENFSITEASTLKHTFVWSHKDTAKSIIRARTFAPDWGIPEDEANGSGSLKLAYMLKKSLKIIHGKGSVIYSKPSSSKSAEVGGRVLINSMRII